MSLLLETRRPKRGAAYHSAEEHTVFRRTLPRHYFISLYLNEAVF